MASTATPYPSSSSRDVASLLSSLESLHQLPSQLKAPSLDELRAHVLSHPLLAGNLPHSSSLGSQIEALRSQLQQSRVTLDQRRTLASQQVQESLQRLQSIRPPLDALPQEVEALEDKIDAVTQKLQTTGTSKDSLLSSLEKHRSTVHTFRSARDYFAILGRAQELWEQALKPATTASSATSDAQLDNLIELAHLVSFTQGLASQIPTNADRDPKALRFLPFLNGKLKEVYTKLAEVRSIELRSALEKAQWPPLSAEQAEAQGKTARDAASILNSKEIKQSWTALTSLQLVGGLLEIVPMPSSVLAQTTGSSLPRPGSEECTPLLTTGLLIEPYLLRFRFHFDSTRTTNRLDKPEWYLNHMLSLVKQLMPLFMALPQRGPAVRLTTPALRRYSKVFTATPQADLLHVLLSPLQAKLSASIPLLLEQHNSAILAHTVSQLLHFDEDLEESLPWSPSASSQSPVKLADNVLGSEVWFDSWVKGEEVNAHHTLDGILEDGDAWTIGASGVEAMDDDEPAAGSWAAAAASSSSKDASTTQSARSLMLLLQGLTDTYLPLPQLSQRLIFVTSIQLPLLRTYQQRLTRSLDAFEGLSSAFARAIPGGIEPGTGLPTGDADMVRGLRGLSRLLKAYLSALHVHTALQKWSEKSVFLEMSEQLLSTDEGRRLLQLQRDEAEERELDSESLGSLIRKGLRSARPLGGTHQATSTQSAGGESIWDEPMQKYGELVKRAGEGIQRLITSEVLESLRPYAQMTWQDAVSPLDEDDDNAPSIPSSVLLSSLTTLNTHLSHLLPILPATRLLPIYKAVAREISHQLVQRVVIVGGSKRFNSNGATRFLLDYQQGWIHIVQGLVKMANPSNPTSTTGALSVQLTGLGLRPEGPWQYLRDVAILLSLPSSTSQGSSTTDDVYQGWTIAKATMTLWSNDHEGMVGWVKMKKDLNLRSANQTAGGEEGLLTKDKAREVIRRRVECLR